MWRLAKEGHASRIWTMTWQLKVPKTWFTLLFINVKRICCWDTVSLLYRLPVYKHYQLITTMSYKHIAHVYCTCTIQYIQWLLTLHVYINTIYMYIECRISILWAQNVYFVSSGFAPVCLEHHCIFWVPNLDFWAQNFNFVARNLLCLNAELYAVYLEQVF